MEDKSEKRGKKILLAILRPPLPAVLFCIALSGAGLVWVLGYHHENSWFAYFMYLFSAYTLVITALPVFDILKKFFLGIAGHLPLLAKLVNDVYFRTRFFLYFSYILNTVYAFLYLIPGIRKRSIWNVTVAAVYMILAAGRFRLSKYSYLHRGQKQDLRAEYTMYVQTGWVILSLDVVIAGCSVLMIMEGDGWTRGSVLVIAIAAYTFYMLGLSIYGVVSYRKFHSPVLSAVRNISLASALFSFLPLTSSMLRAFGTGDTRLNFLLLALTGGIMAAGVFLVGLCSVLKGKRWLRTL